MIEGTSKLKDSKWTVNGTEKKILGVKDGMRGRKKFIIRFQKAETFCDGSRSRR